ncbi:UDP-N-acetylmuramate dehydrogenase [Brevibacterium sanguinis]|uniref:UDP-N-acetylenolpyruvoylglucosamine reductase n=2 Tax=Brevibacterium TaxID=1696 RepID=A0A366IEC3_9MICO|nr:MULTISPECIES: UDP-N-acetylmuramate dehydrogenase [Brevibacterium]RBP62342.1 UDP-N-acetylmuramate dehydrogenase [Brevibacterium sanguinis]RBP68731.1 UDP-N-acetylmuramate dehydrogenase [Brevibacterium celere]
MRLSELTTFRLGGPARALTTARTREELLDFCARHPLGLGAGGDADVLFIGGGSNLLISDAGFDGDVCRVATTGIDIAETTAAEALVTVEAGENWDDVVSMTLSRGLSGLEALSGIPGSVGATPIQNVGAYGTEVGELITSVEVYDRIAGQVRRLSAADLEFGYRTSMLKRTQQRSGASAHLVLSVTFELRRDTASLPIRYSQLASALDLEVGQTAPAALVRDTVLALRRSKGMVLDEADHDTWSAGSFFTNPIVTDAGMLPVEAPRYPVTDPLSGATIEGLTKTSAAWLIEHAGFSKGYRLGAGRASLSTKHTLALTNRGEASTEDVLALARAIVAGVEERYGVTLEPEPTFIGCSL